jgi:predicted RNA methylase
MAKPKSIKDLLKNSQSEILRNISKSAKYVKHDFQDLGYRIALKLNDLSHRSLYMRLSKTIPEPTLTKALSFALDYPLKYGNNRAKIFMWKLKEIRSLEKEEDEQK